MKKKLPVARFLFIVFSIFLNADYSSYALVDDDSINLNLI